MQAKFLLVLTISICGAVLLAQSGQQNNPPGKPAQTASTPNPGTSSSPAGKKDGTGNAPGTASEKTRAEVAVEERTRVFSDPVPSQSEPTLELTFSPSDTRFGELRKTADQFRAVYEKLDGDNMKEIDALFRSRRCQINRVDGLLARIVAALDSWNDAEREGRFGEASSFYSEWIRENPECADAYLGRGRCAAGLGDHLQALEDFGAALDLDPKSAESLCARALSHAALGNSEAALSDLDDSLRLRPDLAEAYCARAVERLRRGQPDAAMEDCCEAIMLRADFAEAYYQRHLANTRLGRTELAAEDYEQARGLGFAGQDASMLNDPDPAPEPLPIESLGMTVREFQAARAHDEPIPEFRTDSVFISYASEDREHALRVKRAFDEAGVDAWLDQIALGSGEDYRRRIETNIENCSYFVPLISRHSTTMEKRFFRREWSKAIQEAEEFPPEYPFIQPLLLDDTSLTSLSIPRQFRDRHVRRIEELPQLIEEAKKRIRERRLQRRLP